MVAWAAGEPLTERWYPLDYHAGQAALLESRSRFRVVPAGRRSGKTECAKRFLVANAIAFDGPDGRFCFAAPTYAQAREIFWEDLLALLPRWLVRKVNETRMIVTLMTGTKIYVVGLDKPQRMEGRHWDGIVIDEIADCKPDAWPRHIRPMLSTRGRKPGWCWFIGVPDGYNHFHELWEKAQAGEEDWFGITWEADGVMDPSELEAARRDLDPVSYAQEYGGKFCTKKGRAYHQFQREVHARGRIAYDPSLDLHVSFDFGNSPGVATVAQVGPRPLWLGGPAVAEPIPLFVGEVYIDSGSTTYAVCDALLEAWGDHPGGVMVYGDAAGGAAGSAAVRGSDWDLVREKLEPAFGDRLEFDVQRANPKQRIRTNAANKMMMNAAGEVRFAVDRRLRHLISSLENTQVDDQGEIVKRPGEKVTHLGDAATYFVWRRWPATAGRDALRQKVHAA